MLNIKLVQSVVMYLSVATLACSLLFWSQPDPLREAAGNEASSTKRPIVFAGHRNWVNSLAFSPDGKTLASGAGGMPRDTGEIILWDVAAGRARAACLGITDAVQGVAFSSDGLTLASASLNQTVRCWDVATLRERIDLVGPSQPEILPSDMIRRPWARNPGAVAMATITGRIDGSKAGQGSAFKTNRLVCSNSVHVTWRMRPRRYGCHSRSASLWWVALLSVRSTLPLPLL
jgi:WD40 repeat protein